jgi:peptide/nickel transport system substrate-binding protein
MAAQRTGEIDFLQRVNPQHVLMEHAKGVTVETAPERLPLVCFMTMCKRLFNDVRVRQAIGGNGLSCKEIAETVLQGRTHRLASILPHGVQEHLDLTEMYPYNPDKAKALLKEAGYFRTNPWSLH